MDSSVSDPAAGILADVPRAAADLPEPSPATDSESPAAVPPLVGYAAPQPRYNGDSPDDEMFRTMKDGLRKGIAVQAVSAPQLFPTPSDVARKLVEYAGVSPGQRVLEPEAGTGAILRAVWGACTGAERVTVVAVEINQRLAESLRDDRRKRAYANESNYAIHDRDFLECTPAELGTFHSVCMNPPFERGADIKHILHARKFLKPGGRLAAVCADGPRQRETLQAIATHYEALPAGTFRDQGTMVNTAIVIIDGPGD